MPWLRVSAVRPSLAKPRTAPAPPSTTSTSAAFFARRADCSTGASRCCSCCMASTAPTCFSWWVWLTHSRRHFLRTRSALARAHSLRRLTGSPSSAHRLNFFNMHKPHAPPRGEGGGHANATHRFTPHHHPPENPTPTAKQYRRRCWPPRPSRLVGPGSTGRGPSLPAPKSPTLSGQGTRQPGSDRCSSRKGRGPLLGGSPPGSWASACVRLDPLTRPTDAWWRLHASIQSPRLDMRHVAEGAGEER